MRIISLVLENIRSYTHAKLEFPEGIVMLSGDIGSGKSTTLLAIEFALFGLLRGELSGAALLRQGKQIGSVELTFQVEGKKYIIKRSLKRSKTSVEQTSGYLITDGAKQTATATELKSKIIEILGYPQDLLTKSKNFVYRYTVYTPQEDMKRILLENTESRLSILRRVFDIDKYSRITQNASGYAKTLRERKRAFDVLLLDMNQKLELEKQTKEKLEHARVRKKKIQPELEKIREEVKKSNQELLQIEERRKTLQDLTRQKHVLQTRIKLKQSQMEQQQTQIEQLSKITLPSEQIPDANALNTKFQETQKELLQAEKTLRELSSKEGEILAGKKSAQETVAKITKLDHCPTCLQDVNDEHKHSIIQTQEQKMQAYDRKQGAHTEQIKNTQSMLSKLKLEIQAIQKKQQEAKIAELKHKHAKEQQERAKQLIDTQTKIQEEIRQSRQELERTEEKIKPHESIENIYSKLKEESRKLQLKERELSIKAASAQQEEKHLAEALSRLGQEIEKKLKAKENLTKVQQTHHWLSDYFIPLIGVIEKHVMAKIHHEFDALFQQWFSILIEDTISARLDDTFTPLVQQNGYDTEIENLSGGERTACALAYRLALNKTINSLISNIKTKDLLILDEPTDGFSAEQLDNMRDVLAQLHLKQIIIVSHEQKVEGFADHVIRIHKENHKSTIV